MQFDVLSASLFDSLDWKIKDTDRKLTSQESCPWVIHTAVSLPLHLVLETMCCSNISQRGNVEKVAGHPCSRGMPANLPLGSRKQYLCICCEELSLPFVTRIPNGSNSVGERTSFDPHFEELLVCHGSKAWCQECEARYSRANKQTQSVL